MDKDLNEQSQREFQKQLQEFIQHMEKDLKQAFAEMKAIELSTHVLKGKNWTAVVNLN